MAISNPAMAASAPSPLWIESPALLEALPGLVHGFTGDLSAGGRLDFDTGLGTHLWHRFGQVPRPHLLRQVHSAEVISFSAPLAAAEVPPPTGDGAALERGMVGLVAVQAADCVPVLAVDRRGGRVAALHAGWRGTAAGILPNLLRSWLGSGSTPEGISIALGPSIRGCCYEVGQDCLDRFAPEALAGAVDERGGRPYLELTRVLRNQAREHGLPEGAVTVMPPCTFCAVGPAGPLYASYRREGRPPAPFTHRNGAYIGLLRGTGAP